MLDPCLFDILQTADVYQTLNSPIMTPTCHCLRNMVLDVDVMMMLEKVMNVQRPSITVLIYLPLLPGIRHDFHLQNPCGCGADVLPSQRLGCPE